MDPVSVRFRWEDPVPGDRWNADAFGAKCADVGRILDGQVVARVFERLEKGSTWAKEYSSQIVKSEGGGGKSSNHCAGWIGGSLESIKEFTEDHLFGKLRDRITCRSCAALADVSQTRDSERLREQKTCFSCNFWMERLVAKAAQPDRRPVIDGRLYFVDDEHPEAPSHCKGFGGGKHVIRWRDGRETVSTNLWHNGEIPAVFRDRFPDDAEFVSQKPLGAPDGDA